MGNSKGVKTSPSGLYWCNVQLSDGKFKLAVGKKISGEDGISIFQLRTCSSQIKTEPGWSEIPDRKGWYQKEFLEDEINEFFNY
jgi:hypothetical protein